jgi:hypothetical protein
MREAEGDGSVWLTFDQRVAGLKRHGGLGFFFPIDRLPKVVTKISFGWCRQVIVQSSRFIVLCMKTS